MITSCAGDPLFGPIGDNLSGPIAIALDPTTGRAYLLNSNLNVAYIDGSLMVLDLSTPTAPTILSIAGNPVSIPGLSGQIFFDAATKHVLFTNRFSENPDDIIDHLFRINIDEAGDFGDIEQFDAGENPFGLACCDGSDQLLATSEGDMQVYPRTNPAKGFEVSLQVTLSNGDTFDGIDTTRVAILGSQAFLSNRAGIIYIINLDKIATLSDNPIDYLITDMEDLRGITTDGSYLYVAEVAFNQNDDESSVRVIDLAAFPPIAAVSPAVIEVSINALEVGGVDIPAQKQQIFVGTNTEPTEVLIFKDKLYVADTENALVYVFDISSPGSIPDPITIDVGSGAFALAAATFGADDLLFVTNLNDNTVSIVNLGSNTVVGTFP